MTFSRLFTMYKTTEIVRFSDTDAAGILYFGSFATYFDENFLGILRYYGLDWEAHKKLDFLLPIIEHKTSFHHPLKFGDEVEVLCYVSRIGNHSFTTNHVIVNKETGEICASGYISRVVVGYDNFVKRDIPTEVKSVLEMLKELPGNVRQDIRETIKTAYSK